MAGIGEHGRIARLDLIDERGDCLIQLAAGEVVFQDDLVEAFRLENAGVGSSIGPRLLQLWQVLVLVVPDYQCDPALGMGNRRQRRSEKTSTASGIAA